MVATLIAWLPALFLLLGAYRSGRCHAASSPSSLNIGILMPSSGYYGYDRHKKVIEHAVHEAGAKYLPNSTMNPIFRDSECVAKYGIGQAYELHHKSDVDVLWGLSCQSVAQPVGLLADKWDLPIYTFSISPDLKDRRKYKTVIRPSCSAEWFGTAAVRLFDHAKWKVGYMIYVSDHDSNICYHSYLAMSNAFTSCGVSMKYTEISVMLGHAYQTDIHGSQVKYAMHELQISARIVILCGPDQFVDDVMQFAYDMNMLESSENGTYMYLAFSLIRSEYILRPWTHRDKTQMLDEKTKFIYRHMLQIASAVADNTTLQKRLLQDIAGYPQDFTSDTEGMDLKGPMYSITFYDMMHYYLHQTSEIIKADSTPGGKLYKSGKAHNEASINNMEFTGITGHHIMNFRSERQCDYKIWYLNEEMEMYRLAFELPMSEAYLNATVCTSWLFASPLKKGRAVMHLDFPPDIPKCGFDGFKCRNDENTQTYVIVGVVVGCILLAVVVILGLLMYRKKRYESEVFGMSWRIPCDELIFSSDTATITQADAQSTAGVISTAANIETHRKTTGGTIYKKRLVFSNTSMADQSIKSQTRRIADYHGNTVSVKLMPVYLTSLSKKDLIQLKQLKDLNHDNLDKFYGICISNSTILYVSSYCGRGNLQDILQHEHMKLDDTFRQSFIRELIKGMKYLHKSPMRLHGRLKSTCCLLDSRWMLKISDLGLAGYRLKHYETENEKYTALLWTAPELLRIQDRMHTSYIDGTPEGDIYSFAIIVHEIMQQGGPFPVDEDISRKAIIRRVIAGENPPLRPYIHEESGGNVTINDIMIKCWDENPDVRPDFTEIANVFATLKKHNVNIIDNVIKMMEDYHSSLEELIEERAGQLSENIKKTTELLYKMMPRPVVNRLVTGNRSFSENFREAAIFFSGVSGFTALSMKFPPLAVVQLLDRLFKKFDEVLMKFNVYRIETTEDAYAVVCGVPTANPRHTAELADMAITMRNAVSNFQIAEIDNYRVLVQMGLHCGPVAAGVIGTIRPRFCVFGNTVNTASRMMFTSIAMHIQLTEEMFESLNSSKYVYFMKERGSFDVKGKGTQMTYFLLGRKGMPWFSEYP